MDVQTRTASPEQVSFAMRRSASAIYPICALQGATRQVHAERIVGELLDPQRPEAIGFDYHTEAVDGETCVVLTVHGSDELRVREVAQRLDEHYHGQPLYEAEVDKS